MSERLTPIAIFRQQTVLALRADRRSEPDYAVSFRIPVTLPQATSK